MIDIKIMEEHPFDLQAYEPPLSLWNLVEQHVSPYEQTEIKNMLGESLVDQTLELHGEVRNKKKSSKIKVRK